MVLKWDQRRAYAAIPFISAPGITLWISLSSEAVDRLWSARVDDKSFKSHLCNVQVYSERVELRLIMRRVLVSPELADVGHG